MNKHIWSEPKKVFIFSGSSNPVLAQEVAEYLELTLGKVKLERFPDGETFVQYQENIRGGDVYIIQSTCPPANETLMELLIMLDAARRSSAARITAVIPFFGYARQDRKDRPRVPITAKLVANLITAAGADRILTMDLHATQIQGFFDIPVDHLYGSKVFVPYLKNTLGEHSVVVAPDSGSVKMAHAYGDMLNTGLAVVSKRRVDAGCVESSHLVGDVDGRTCLITDDMTSTCGTLIGAANLLKQHGAAKIYAAVSHSLLTEAGMKRLDESCIEELICTNSIPILVKDGSPKVRALSIAAMMGEAIRRTHNGESISSLFVIEKP